MSSYFVGITFHPLQNHFKKIDSFRQRFDSKFVKSKLLQMSLIPPFELQLSRSSDRVKLLDELGDIVDGHLHGIDELSRIQFKGIDFLSNNKHVLYLTPQLPEELKYCIESIYEVLGDYGAIASKKRIIGPNHRIFLPIGRFDNPFSLQEALATAQVEFSHSFEMLASGISLFENSMLRYDEISQLHRFKTQPNIGPTL